MQQHEQTTTAAPEGAATEQLSEAARQRQKALAIRLDEGVHAQLRFIAQLSGTSVTEEVRQAIETRIAAAQDGEQLIARAQQLRDEIQREAETRAAAIAGFIGKPATVAAGETQPSPGTRQRAAPTTSPESKQ